MKAFCNLCARDFESFSWVHSLSTGVGKAYICRSCLGLVVKLAFTLGVRRIGDEVVFTAGKGG